MGGAGTQRAIPTMLDLVQSRLHLSWSGSDVQLAAMPSRQLKTDAIEWFCDDEHLSDRPFDVCTASDQICFDEQVENVRVIF